MFSFFKNSAALLDDFEPRLNPSKPPNISEAMWLFGYTASCWSGYNTLSGVAKIGTREIPVVVEDLSTSPRPSNPKTVVFHDSCWKRISQFLSSSAESIEQFEHSLMGESDCRRHELRLRDGRALREVTAVDLDASRHLSLVPRDRPYLSESGILLRLQYDVEALKSLQVLTLGVGIFNVFFTGLLWYFPRR